MKFIDTHIHCVPWADDGAQTMDEAAEMVNMLLDQGTEAIYCTVHSYALQNMACEKDIYDNMLKLQEKMYEDYDKNIQLRMVNEIEISKENFNDVIDDFGDVAYIYRPYCDRYYLFEFGYHDSAENIVYICSELVKRNIIPVIAHAERYDHILECVKELREMGCIIQVNVTSFTRLGFISKYDVTMKLLKGDYIDILGTDAHRINWRPPVITDGIEEASKIITVDKLEDLCYRNASRLFGLNV